jgi:hypothetical protein
MSDAWITAALEEYRTLREESLSSIEQMQRTLQIGLVAIGVLTAFGVDVTKSNLGIQAGLAITTPLVAAVVVALRLDELLRAVKAGAHIAVLEQRVAQRTGEGGPPLTWESTIQEDFDPREDKRRHGAITAVLFAATAPAVLLGTSRLEQWWQQFLVIAVVALILVLTTVYQRHKLDQVAGLHKAALEEITTGSSEAWARSRSAAADGS